MRAQAPSRPRLPPCAPRQQPCRCARRRRPCRARAGAAEGAPAPDKRRAAVVGGGWAAFAAAWTLTRSGFDVTLLDAAQTPGGVAAGQAELGVKGYARGSCRTQAYRRYASVESGSVRLCSGAEQSRTASLERRARSAERREMC